MDQCEDRHGDRDNRIAGNNPAESGEIRSATVWAGPARAANYLRVVDHPRKGRQQQRRCRREKPRRRGRLGGCAANFRSTVELWGVENGAAGVVNHSLFALDLGYCE